MGDINPPSDRGPRIASFAGLCLKYGDLLKRPGYFTMSELALLDEWSRGADHGRWMQAADVKTEKALDEKLSRIADRVRLDVPELANHQRDRVLMATCDILKSYPVKDEPGIEAASSTARWPQSFRERAPRRER